MSQVLARKWRPKNFKELVGQQHVAQALGYALDRQHFHHAYLFTGTRGVGKTTVARIFAKSINCLINGVSAEPCGNCEHCLEIDAGRFPDLIEVDAASRTQVDNTRQLLSTVPYKPIKGRYKVYLIDEVHMLSDGSFNALLKTLEEPPEHVKFILATTDPQKIPPTVISRCLQFQLKNMTEAQIATHLQTVLQSEQIAFEEEALHLLAEAAQGSMRDGLSLLDQAIAYGQGEIRTQDIAALLGAVPAVRVRALFACLTDGNARGLREEYARLEEYSPDYSDLLRRLLQGLQEISIAQLEAQRFSGEVHQEMEALAARLPLELVQLWYQIATDAWQSLPYQPDAALAVEMALLRMLALQPVFPLQSLSRVRVAKEAAPLQPPTPENSAREKALLTNESSPETEDDASSSPEVAKEPAETRAADAPPWEEKDQTAAPQPENRCEEVAPQAEERIAEISPAAAVQEDEPQEDTAAEDLPLFALDRSALAACVNQPQRWAALLRTFPGMEKDFFAAENVYPVSLNGAELALEVDGGGKIWASSGNLSMLEKALAAALGENIRVTVSGEAQQATAFQQHRAEVDAQLAQAKEKFKQHPAVLRLIERLDGEVDEQSIVILTHEESSP